jgi:hypothetical protein
MRSKKDRKIKLKLVVPLLLSFLVIIQAPKAEAVVVVTDPSDLPADAVTSGMTTAEKVKEYALDKIAFAMAKAMIGSVVDSIVDWINTGFKGGPLFITDTNQFLLDTAEQASGALLESLGTIGDVICAPFDTAIRISLAQFRKKRPAFECTYKTVLGNVLDFANFLKDFRHGGWDTWIKMASTPTADPYGAQLLAIDVYSDQIAAAKNQSQAEAIWSSGFFGLKECKEYKKKCVKRGGPRGQACLKYEPAPETDENCTKWVTTTPGRYIADQVGITGSSWLRQLELADEMDEIISALINQLVRLTIQGFGELVAGNYEGRNWDYNEDENDAHSRIKRSQEELLANMKTIEKDEEEFNDMIHAIRQEYTAADNVYKNSISSAVNCYNDYKNKLVDLNTPPAPYCDPRRGEHIEPDPQLWLPKINDWIAGLNSLPTDAVSRKFADQIMSIDELEDELTKSDEILAQIQDLYATTTDLFTHYPDDTNGQLRALEKISQEYNSLTYKIHNGWEKRDFMNYLETAKQIRNEFEKEASAREEQCRKLNDEPGTPHCED